MVSVNGRIDGGSNLLGKGYDLPDWDQWAGIVTTDSRGYGQMTISIEKAAVVRVPGAALFSNTQYATLWYGRESKTETAFAHTLSFKANGGGVSVSTGYTLGTESSMKFRAIPLTRMFVGLPSFAATYWCNGGTASVGWTCGGPRVVATGITTSLLGADWGGYLTTEYIDPDTLAPGSYAWFELDRGIEKLREYRESGTYTWSVTGNAPFTIKYKAFSVDITLETTLSGKTGVDNYTAFSILHDSGQLFTFWVYTAGTVIDLDKKLGGMELHVWNRTPGGG